MENIKTVQKLELEMILEINRISKLNSLKYFLAYGSVLGAIRHKGFIPWDTDIDIIVEIDKYEKFCEILKAELNDKYELQHFKYDSNYDSLKARVSLKGELHQLIHIDIFPVAGAPDGFFSRKVYSKIAYLNYKCFFIKKLNVNINYKNNPRKKKQAILAKLLLLLIPSRFFIWNFKKISTVYSIDKTNTLCNICGSYGEKELFPKKYLESAAFVKFEGHDLPIPIEWDQYLTNIYGDYMTPKKNNYI